MSRRKCRELERAATRLLRKAGATWSGRARKSVDQRQAAFERQCIRIPTNGKPR